MPLSSAELNVMKLLAALSVMLCHFNVTQFSLVALTAIPLFLTALSSMSMSAVSAAFNMMSFHSPIFNMIPFHSAICSAMNGLFAAFMPGSNAMMTKIPLS